MSFPSCYRLKYYRINSKPANTPANCAISIHHVKNAEDEQAHQEGHGQVFSIDIRFDGVGEQTKGIVKQGNQSANQGKGRYLFQWLPWPQERKLIVECDIVPEQNDNDHFQNGKTTE